MDSGGNVSEQSSRVIAAWLECFPEKSSWCRNQQVCQEVKCLEPSSGLDTMLYKNIHLLFCSCGRDISVCACRS